MHEEQIRWDSSGHGIKLAVVDLCGWITRKGDVTKTGKKIAGSHWKDLSLAAKNVLTRHGITK